MSLDLVSGYREVEHTADWALEVWAPDLPCLFEQAARGLYTLTGVRLAPGPRLHQTISLNAYDIEGLLVSFLAELLHLSRSGERRLGCDQYAIKLAGNHLQADVGGAPILSMEKEIKAVTYHNLKIYPIDVGFRVTIVFDV